MGTAGQQVFELLAPLADRAEGQHHLRASNVQLRLPEPPLRSPAPSWRWRSQRHDLGHHEPTARRGEDGVKAADVLAGHDQDCGAWIAAHRAGGDAAGAGSGRGPASARRTPRPRRRLIQRPWIARRSDVVFCARQDFRSPSMRAPPAARCGTRQAGADLDSTCGGRGLCGRCQVVPTAGSFSEVANRVDRRFDSPVGPRPKRTTPGAARSATVSVSAAQRRCAATSSSRSPRQAKCTSRSSASRSISATSRSTRWCDCTTSSYRRRSSVPSSAG